MIITSSKHHLVLGLWQALWSINQPYPQLKLRILTALQSRLLLRWRAVQVLLLHPSWVLGLCEQHIFRGRFFFIFPFVFWTNKHKVRNLSAQVIIVFWTFKNTVILIWWPMQENLGNLFGYSEKKNADCSLSSAFRKRQGPWTAIHWCLSSGNLVEPANLSRDFLT